LPAFLCLLFLLILDLNLFPRTALTANFLGLGSRFALTNILHKLEHLGDPFVVFLEAANLLVQDSMFFVSHLEVLGEALDVSLKSMVLISQLRVEILMEVEVTLHVRHFTVPEVELATLVLIVLLHE